MKSPAVNATPRLHLSIRAQPKLTKEAALAHERAKVSVRLENQRYSVFETFAVERLSSCLV